MDAIELRKHLNRQPFQPFRIHLSDGAQYDVPHGDFMLVTHREVAVAVGLSSHDDVPDEMVYCDPYHITRIEPIIGRTKKRSTPKSRKN